MRTPMPDRMRRAFLALTCALLASCVARTPSPPSPPSSAAVPVDMQAPADFPQALYRQGIANGKTVLRIDPGQSLVAVEVRRGGPLAGLGHDHVVASHDVRGYVLPSDGRADLYLPLARLVVDEPALRAEAGMDTQPTQDAIAGTHRNMLEKVLDSERFPFALVNIARIAGNAGTPDKLKVAVTLHGKTRTYDAQARIDDQPEKMLVTGRIAVSQTDFGITPFSVLGGALQVQDRLEMRFRIVATGG